MTDLDDIINEIQARKIVVDKKELRNWLFEYSFHYAELSGESIRSTAYKKANEILNVADELYWQFNKQLELDMLPYENIPSIAKRNYEKRQQRQTLNRRH